MKKRVIRTVILILLIIVFCISAFMLVFIKVRGNAEQAAFDELTEAVRSADTGSDADVPANEILPKYKELSDSNPDFAAWLYVPGTLIDYPVMYTPDEPNYYLRRAFDGSSAVSGTPFIGLGCSPESDCIIVHGHNMKNDSMFGTLDYYTDEEFARSHPDICFDSLYEQRSYTVFAAVKSDVVPFGQDGYRYYDHGGYLSDEEYSELISWLLQNSLYSIGYAPPAHSQILLLSTCSYHSTDGRLVVAFYKTP